MSIAFHILFAAICFVAIGHCFVPSLCGLKCRETRDPVSIDCIFAGNVLSCIGLYHRGAQSWNGEVISCRIKGHLHRRMNTMITHSKINRIRLSISPTAWASQHTGCVCTCLLNKSPMCRWSLHTRHLIRMCKKACRDKSDYRAKNISLPDLVWRTPSN